MNDPNKEVAKILFDGGDLHLPHDLRAQADFSEGGAVEKELYQLNSHLEVVLALGGTSLTALRKPGDKPFVLTKSDGVINADIDFA